MIELVLERESGRRGRVRPHPLTLVLLGGLALAALLEAGLRLAPGAIPLALLDHLPYHVRQRIDVGEGLFSPPRLLAVPRDDGGPELLVMAPGTVVTHRLGAVDLRQGAVETVTLDDTGFCNPPTRRWAGADVDAVVLGDSFAWCSGVAPEQAWPARLEALGGRSTYNLGRGGVGVFEYVQILKRYGLRHKPEVVILNLFEGNDLTDAQAYWRTAAAAGPRAGGLAVPASSRAAEQAGQRPLGQRLLHALASGTPLGDSYAIRLGFAVYDQLEATLRDATVDAGDFSYRVRVGNGDEVTLNVGNDARDFAPAWALAKGEATPSELLEPGLASFAELARREGFRAVVTYTPAPYTAYEGRIDFDKPSLAELTQRFSQTQRAWLREATRRQGLEFLDLTPALQAAAAAHPGPLYFPDDLHLTAAGHEAIAAYLAAALRGPAVPGDSIAATAAPPQL